MTKKIEATIRTTATPEQCYAVWTQPEHLAGWFVDRAEGEAKPGGTLTWHFDKYGFSSSLKIVEIIENERLVMEHPGFGDLPPTVQEVTIARDGGETVIRLVHSGFRDDAEWDDEYEGVRSGWQIALGILRRYLDQHFGEPKRALLAMRPAAFEFDQLGPLFRDAGGLAKWLTSAGTIGAVGSDVALALRDGGTITGEVLADTGREVAVTWDEIRGILELKAFTYPQGSKTVALRATTWSLPDDLAAQTEEVLERALSRLVEAL